MKIVAISQPCFTATNREIFRRINDSDNDVAIIVPEIIKYPSGVKKAQEKQPNDPEMIFVKTKRNNPRLQKILGLTKILDSLKPDIVFLDNDPGCLQAISIGRWCKRNNAKFIVQTCENLPFDVKSSYKRLGLKGIALSLMKKTFNFLSKKNINYVFTINNDGTNIFKNLKYKNVIKIPLGFNENLFNDFPQKGQTVREKLLIKNTIIAYFGRIVHEKGIHILLEALAKIKHLEWTLILDDFELYKNSYAETINKLIVTLELSDRIKYIKADHREIADYMNASDIVVLASVSTATWKEQYGRVIPEAMACENAVIVADSGALSELVGDTGIVIPEKDVDLLAENLTVFIKNKQIQIEYKEKAYLRAHKYLSVQSQFEIYNDVFEKLNNTK